MAVSPRTRYIVWGRSAGRCLFPGCNKRLIGDLIAGNDDMNAAYVAHIVAETPGGPRGDPVRSPALSDDPANLMLLCDPHHRLIDSKEELENYSETRLLEIKRAAEKRIELSTDISPDRASHIVRYGAMIGANESVIAASKCKEAMIASHYPASREPIDLSMSGLALADSDPNYYSLQARNLQRQFDAKIRGRLESQEIDHLSVFALAPIPLLIELGRLLSDIRPCIVYQLHREPAGWGWARDGDQIELVTSAPENAGSQVALKLALSANVSDDRIYSVLGKDTSIWQIAARNPHNDCIRYPEDVSQFRQTLRQQLNAIKTHHGDGLVINVFPAIPVSIAVETGRVWMPKADLGLRIFDQSKDDAGFIERLLLA